ncbi:MAG: hypothetical protein JST80_11035 [Bdellovibrionales bacterium]|nr:hypothetical protein [Bdellovibrionales bacterium]
MPESIHQIWTSYLQGQEVISYLTQIYAAHEWGTILCYQIGWLIFFWTVLPWRLSKSSSWGGKLWTQTWLGAIYWAGALYLIPAMIWQEPYRNLFSYSLKALFKMLLA